MAFWAYIVAKQKTNPVAIEMKSTSLEDHIVLSSAIKIICRDNTDEFHFIVLSCVLLAVARSSV